MSIADLVDLGDLTGELDVLLDDGDRVQITDAEASEQPDTDNIDQRLVYHTTGIDGHDRFVTLNIDYDQ